MFQERELNSSSEGQTSRARSAPAATPNFSALISKESKARPAD